MKITFLGTGASGGTPGTGKSKRLESSIIFTDDLNILIDVSRDFAKEAKNFKKFDVLLLTHGHRDACGGISQLKSKAVYAHPKTISLIKERYKRLSHNQFFPVYEGKVIKLDRWQISALEVPHSYSLKFPTFAWKLNYGFKSVVYASDISSLTEKFKKFCQGVDVLIIDGATWKRKIFTHLRVDKDLPQICKWKVGRVILTQIGKSAPPHEEFKKEIFKICLKAIPAFDGMKLSI